jgi:hypothetical protein
MERPKEADPEITKLFEPSRRSGSKQGKNVQGL